jgi:hypothetical protein
MKSALPAASLLLSLWIACSILSGCGPIPPIPYQQLQVQDTEQAQGYDVYLYIAVTKDRTPQQIESLLKWFDSVKYPSVNKMAVFVWNNPQAALMGSSADLVGSLDVDRGAGKYDLTVPGL